MSTLQLIPAPLTTCLILCAHAYPATVTFNGVIRMTDGVFKDVPADANGNMRGSVARKGTIARLAGLQIQGIFKKLINQ